MLAFFFENISQKSPWKKRVAPQSYQSLSPLVCSLSPVGYDFSPRGWRIIPLGWRIFPSLLSVFFFFSPLRAFLSKLFRIFAVLSAHNGCDVHWDVRSRRVEHYILKGVTDALFLDSSNYHNRNSNPRQMHGWLPRGVAYTLRSVLRGSSILNAHFTGVYILQRGCFSVCFLQRLW